MRGSFNGVCQACNSFKPRCATIYWRKKGNIFHTVPQILCEGCRKKHAGEFRLDEKHTGRKS
jgi:hypothetical protein